MRQSHKATKKPRSFECGFFVVSCAVADQDNSLALIFLR